MVAGAAPVFGIVAFCLTFLFVTAAGEHRGVHIQSDGVELEFVKEPAIAAGVYSGGAGLVKKLEQTNNCFVACGMAPPK